MKILAFLMTCFVTISIHAQSADKITALYLIGSEGSFVANGQSLVIKESPDWVVTVRQKSTGISFYFNCKANYSHWGLDFYAPPGLNLLPGTYRNAARYPFNRNEAGLDVSGDGCGCNEVGGVFEVLDIEYDVDKNIISFAANFVEKCEKTFPPIFGSIRYNSDIPLGTRFIEMFANSNKNLVYLQRKNINENEILPEVRFFTGDNKRLQINALPYGGDGAEFVIDMGNEELWVLDFAVPLEDNLTKGSYFNAEKYPYNGFLTPGIDVISPDGSFDSSLGWFQVLKCTKNDDGSIQEIALTFELKNDYEILEGAIHYKAEPLETTQDYDDDSEIYKWTPEIDSDSENDNEPGVVLNKRHESFMGFF